MLTVLCKDTSLRMRLIIGVYKNSINITLFWQSYYVILTIYLSIIYITDMLPQHRINIRELISECFLKYDFSKEQRNSLRMI